MAELAHFTVYRGDDHLLRIVMTTNGSVSGWTTKLTVRKTPESPDPPVLSISGSVNDPGDGVTPGIFECTLSQAQLLTLEARLYAYSFKRTNSGTAATLLTGTMQVEADVLNAVA